MLRSQRVGLGRRGSGPALLCHAPPMDLHPIGQAQIAGSTIAVGVFFMKTPDRAGRVSQGWLTQHDEPSQGLMCRFLRDWSQEKPVGNGCSSGGGLCAQFRGRTLDSLEGCS